MRPGAVLEGHGPSVASVDGVSRWRRWSERPVLVVAFAGLVVMAIHLWLIHAHRHLGTFDLDEAGYLAQSMRLQRLLTADGVRAAWRVLPTETGPLVPVLSVPFLLVHPRSPQAAMVVQPIFHVVSAVAVSGIVSRLAGRVHAIVAGILVLGLPAAIVAARTYSFAGAATVTLCLAVWALLASEHGSRPWPLVGFGAAIGAMVLARTMTVAFLPALAIAAAVQLRRDRRTILGLAGAALAMAIIAGPWWLTNFDTATGYLTSFGYGEVSNRFGPATSLLRVLARAGGLVADARPLLFAVAVVIWVGGLRGWRRLRPERGRKAWRDRLTDAGRDRLTVWSVILVGYLSLLSSSNTGTGFDLPLVALLVAASVPLVDHLRPVWQRRVAIGAVAVAALNIVAIGTVFIGSRKVFYDGGEPKFSAGSLLFSETQAGDEPLAGPGRLSAWNLPIEGRNRAAAKWWKSSVELVWALDRLEARTPGGAIRTVTGSADLVSANSILLAEEISGSGARILTDVNENEPDASVERLMRPRREGHRNALVLLQTTARTPEEGRRKRQVMALARSEGWVDFSVIDLPDGGRAYILVHP